jgi:hypothetical protein
LRERIQEYNNFNARIGKEPAHFRGLFKGRNIIHAGGKASGFNNSNEGGISNSI